MAKKNKSKDENGLMVSYEKDRKSIVNGKSWVFTDSLNLADVLDYQHNEVLKKVRKVLSDYKINKNNYEICFYKDKKNEKRPYYKLSKELTKLVAKTCQSLLAKRFLDSIGCDIYTTRKEVDFVECVETQLKIYNIPLGQTQYKICTYFIDYYIPKLNIAIEYDENNHDKYTYEQQEGRQAEIEKKLGCKFIRVSDKKSHLYNSTYVLKEILKMYPKITLNN